MFGFEVVDNPLGRRVYWRGYRLHHGFTGLLMAALGMALAAHDRRDYKSWLPRHD